MRDFSARERTASANAKTRSASAMFTSTPVIGNSAETSVARNGTVAKNAKRRARSAERMAVLEVVTSRDRRHEEEDERAGERVGLVSRDPGGAGVDLDGRVPGRL